MIGKYEEEGLPNPRRGATAVRFTLTLLYLPVFSIASARERRWFWTTTPSKTLMAALVADSMVGTTLTYVGLPGLKAFQGGRHWRSSLTRWFHVSW
jgi:hypothetical protein